MKRNLFLLLVSFLFLGSIHAQDQYTPVGDPYDGTFMLQVWADVQIDGVSQTSSSIEIGMFLDDECKASARIQAYFNGNFYRVKPYCTYDGAGQVITFKLYNHANNEELNCDYTATTTGNDMTIGTNAQNCIVLNFVHEVTPTYDITVTANPTEGGTVDGGGTFDVGTSVTVTATPAEGYTFVNWTEDGTEVSAEASYTFEVTAARALVANFEGSSTEPEYPWVIVNGSNGASNAVCTAIVQINGELITDGTDWEVGAFAGDICRGIGNLENGWVEIPEEAQSDVPYTYYMMMTLHGNNGEELSFKLANRATGEVHPGVCDVTITYQHDGEFGDPWDPVILNFVTEQTFTKDILGYTNSKDRYYLIASPIGEVNPENVTNMLSNTYDLYRFNQSPTVIQGIGLEWENYKNESYNLEVGKGYLYANSADVTLTFTGRPYSGDGEFPLVFDRDASFAGWNLVGNPFAEAATIDREFYTMNTDGSEIIAGEGNTVAAMEGVFVVATGDDQSVTFTPGTSKAREGIMLNLSRNRGVIDRAIVRFDENSVLPKFMLNQDNTKLYIPQDNEDFAVVSSATQGEMPVNFKAAENGTYTLSINTENVQMNYLHLIDNMTGADVNLLETPSYSFNALTTDYSSRFKLVFATGLSEDNFAFYSNGQWIISNEGKAILQVIDVNGRILSDEQINGSCSKQINAAPGVYMLRLVKGNDVKVQKVVVK